MNQSETNIFRSQGYIPDLGFGFDMENGVRAVPPAGHAPFNRYRTGLRGLDNPNTLSILKEETANSERRIPLKGSVFNEFPPFLAQPQKTSSKPTILVHIGKFLPY